MTDHLRDPNAIAWEEMKTELGLADAERAERMDGDNTPRNVYTIGYTSGMRIRTLSVREAREQLSSVLDAFRNGDRTPVGIGSHRKTEAVMVPIEVYDELVAERERAAAQAEASVRAEGLTTSSEADAITDLWKRGEISTAEMRARIRALHGVA